MKKKEKSEYAGLTWDEAYRKAVKAVDSGEPFRCDLSKHNLWVGGEPVVTDGSFEGDMGSQALDGDPMRRIEELYASYKRSVPSERSERRRRSGCQFMALDLDDLSDDDMVYGERRETAQARLEMFVLFSILSGALKWHDSWGTWFWRSEKDRDLVLLKDWFKKQKENDT